MSANASTGMSGWRTMLCGCTPNIWSTDEFMPKVDEEICLLLNEPPRCPKCGAMARPNVLMFGDWSWSPRRTAIQSQHEEEWLEAIGDHQRVVVVELGAGTAIPSVRNFSQRIIYELGGRLVRINPREFQVPGSVDVGIPLGSLEALVGIYAALGDMPVDVDLDFT
jgi:NAD-dependent SIR2 family protein deacetylase